MDKYHRTYGSIFFWFESKNSSHKKVTDRLTDTIDSFQIVGIRNYKKIKDCCIYKAPSTKDYFFYKTELIFIIYS